MKTMTNKSNTLLTGSLFAVAAFILLSVFADGLVEFSRDVGFVPWLLDVLVYSFFNKLAYKLVASVAIGGTACFVSSMIAYGKSVRQKRSTRAAAVRFQTAAGDSEIGRTA